MDYADRISRIPPYLFAEIDRAVAQKRGEGVDVISLGVGDPDLPTPANIVAKLGEAAQDASTHQYPSYVGMLSFRQAVADYYQRRFKVKLSPENQVVTLIGSKEGIAHIPLAFVNPGDTVLAADPAYPVYKIGTILAGGKPKPMPLLAENDFLPDLSKVDGAKAKLMFLNYPNAPTGACATEEFFKEVVDFARDNDVIVCHDNPYCEMTFDGYTAPSFLETKGALEVGIEFNSLSKTYNMTGWRVGFAVGNAEILAGLGKVKENVDSGAFNAVQEAGIEALTGPQDAVAENMKVWQQRRDVMVEGLSKLGWSVTAPKATFYLWIPVPNGEPSIEFARRVLDECGVVVTPGVGFGDHGEGYIRLALTQNEERLKEALERLSKLK